MCFILQKELKSFFSTPTGYIIIALFFMFMAMFLWILPGEFNVLDGGYASVDGLFNIAPWLYLFLCPAISMRFISEEKNVGTIELLLTKPISKLQIILGKILAGWILVLISLLPTILWFVSVYFLAEPMGNVDTGAFWGSWIGLLLLALSYISIGTFSSTLTQNQVISFIVAALLSFLMFYGFELFGSLFSGNVAYWLRNCGIQAHYESISRGVIDSRDIIYFIFISSLFIYFSIKKLK